ncbi:hypothetical protein [Pseudomonas sp. 25 R 14]|nr:hypothetical protein [Pseudomonas sp. 25 R 14]
MKNRQIYGDLSDFYFGAVRLAYRQINVYTFN